MSDPTSRDVDTPPYLSERTTKILGSVMCVSHFVFSTAVLLLAPVVRAESDPRADLAPSGVAVLGLLGVGFGSLVLLVALWYRDADVLRRIGAAVTAGSTLVLLAAVLATSTLVGVIYLGEVCFVALIGFLLVKLPKAAADDATDTGADTGDDAGDDAGEAAVNR